MVAITEKEFRQFSDYIRVNFGIYLKAEKQTLLTGRLSNVLEQNNFETFSQYYDYIISDKTGDAAISLVDRITTNYTYFMRETDHFDYFRDQVLPSLKTALPDKDLRIWCAGCATGEEAYTLAFILAQYFFGDPEWDRTILATDISTAALAKAKHGSYGKAQIASLPASWQKQYFTKEHGETCEVAHQIKKEIIFQKFNLMQDDFYFKKPFHVIFCRNVMIYFDKQTKNELIQRFYDITAPGGYLFIGHSESILKGESSYQYIMPAVYRKL